MTNTFKGTLSVSDSSKISGGNALDLSGETSRGIGGCAIYTNLSTDCTEIVVTDSELTGGDGGHSWNGSALELNTGTPEVTITNSTLTVGQGENSNGNAGAIRVNSNTIHVDLEGVTLNGDGNGNTVIQVKSNVTTGGISLAGETTISGGTLENVEFVDIAEGATIKTSGTGAVDAATVTNPTQTPVYDDATGGYVFAPVVQTLDTVLVNSNWSSLPAGSVVQYGDEYYRLGTNAFDNIADAVATDVSSKILVLDGSYDDNQYFNGHEVEIGTADTAVDFDDNYVFGGAHNKDTGDINLKFVNGSAGCIYGAAADAAGDYEVGNITIDIGEDVTVSGRMAAAKVDAGSLTTGNVTVNYAGNSPNGSSVPLFGGAQA